MRKALLFTSAVWLCLQHAEAQEPTLGRGMEQVSLSSGWQRVQALPVHTLIHVRADHQNAVCLVDVVSAEHLSCSNPSGSEHHSFLRGDVQNIKLTRRSHSAILASAIGFGLGAGGGAAVGSQFGPRVHVSSDNRSVHLTHGNSALQGAAIGGLFGGVVGLVRGYRRDSFPGTLIYRRP